jgi:hypothetical protein
MKLKQKSISKRIKKNKTNENKFDMKIKLNQIIGME